jgi:hypothetical protein
LRHKPQPIYRISGGSSDVAQAVHTLSGTFLLLLSLLSFGCGDSSSSGGTLTGIDIAPISPSIAVGGTVQFTATGHFSNGQDQNITAQSN